METEGSDEGGGGTGRACNINPFNKLIIDEIYRAFTVRGGGANVLHLSQGNSGYISGFAPLRLDLRACANEPRPASATKRRRCTGRCSSIEERYSYEDAARVMDVAKNLSEMGKKGKQGRGLASVQSTNNKLQILLYKIYLENYWAKIDNYILTYKRYKWEEKNTKFLFQFNYLVFIYSKLDVCVF